MACTMQEDIIDSLDIVIRNIKNYIACENVPGGLLEDVNTIIRSVSLDGTVDEPAIWIVQHPTIMEDEKAIYFGGTQKLQTTVEFLCVENDDDLEVAEMKGLNLATRVGKCILKNINRVKDKPDDPKHIFEKVMLETLYPAGEITVEGKAKRIPATSIIFKFTYPVNWRKCRPNIGD